MPGEFSVTPTIILQLNDLSLYIHCASHGLNLAVTSSCKLQNVEKKVGICEEIASLFTHQSASIAGRNNREAFNKIAG